MLTAKVSKRDSTWMKMRDLAPSADLERMESDMAGGETLANDEIGDDSGGFRKERAEQAWYCGS